MVWEGHPSDIEYETKKPDSEDDLLVKAINKNCKYVLTEWWYEPKDISFQNSYIPNAEPLTDEQKTIVEDSVKSFSNWDHQDDGSGRRRKDLSG